MQSSHFQHEPIDEGRLTNGALVRPSLGLKAFGFAEKQFLADHAIIQDMWRDVQEEASIEQVSTVRRDYSENGVILMAGRTLLSSESSAMPRPVYWAVRDNRVHFSVPFNMLTSQQRMELTNQVLISYAGRSQKADLKSAALAVSDNGHFYVAMNTQELTTMDWVKECAEDNLTRVVKQLANAGEKIAHIYVLGGIVNERGHMHVADHLIGMCMRCVEIVSAIMHPQGKVTIIPANDGASRIELHKTDDVKKVLPREAWQVNYDVLKGPSIIDFPADVHAREAEAFEAICAGEIVADELIEPYGLDVDTDSALRDATRGVASIPLLEANHSPEAINAYMIAQLARQVKRGNTRPDHISGAVVEINDRGKLRYAFASELRGPGYNAMQAPVSGAVSQTALPRPDAQDRPYVQRVWVTGYNADGSPLNMNAEQWDRLLKRVGSERRSDTQVNFIPFNQGIYPQGDSIVRELDALAPTDFAGSKQERHRHGFGGQCC